MPDFYCLICEKRMIPRAQDVCPEHGTLTDQRLKLRLEDAARKD